MITIAVMKCNIEGLFTSDEASANSLAINQIIGTCLKTSVMAYVELIDNFKEYRLRNY